MKNTIPFGGEINFEIGSKIKSVEFDEVKLRYAFFQTEMKPPLTEVFRGTDVEIIYMLELLRI
jgi:hypothetical protein